MEDEYLSEVFRRMAQARNEEPKPATTKMVVRCIRCGGAGTDPYNNHPWPNRCVACQGTGKESRELSPRLAPRAENKGSSAVKADLHPQQKGKSMEKDVEEIFRKIASEPNLEKRTKLYDDFSFEDTDEQEQAGILCDVGLPRAREALFEEYTGKTLKKETTKMAKGKGIIDLTKNAAKTGAKQAVATEAGDIALDALIKAVPALKPFAADENGRALLRAVAAIALSYVAEISEFEGAGKVQVISELIITVSAQQMTQAKLKQFTPALKKIAALAKNLPDVAASAS